MMGELFELPGNVSKEKFRQTMNRLLNECFILKRAADTSSEYRFIIANEDVIREVLDLLGYELVIRDDQGVITINNPSGQGRIHFSKIESILVLIIRLLYIEKMRELSQIQDAIIILEEVYEKYAMLGIGRLGKTQLLNALRNFKRYNLIQNLDRLDGADAGTRIQIYPSILFAVTASSLEDMYETAKRKLAEYGKEEDDDIADENTPD